jgi:hypothetical protein
VRHAVADTSASGLARSGPTGGARRRTRAPMRPPVRPLDDGTTEAVRVIEFLWISGNTIQPVLMLERELLD